MAYSNDRNDFAVFTQTIAIKSCPTNGSSKSVDNSHPVWESASPLLII